ncbi:MAG: hypothetical protein Q4D85_00230 [Corynebacterium sp.]|uniref:hypothetical protein n=1 Tax=Corynebacterium sp. TaxID=1720 RepID=UPI0026DC0CA1|nr:hypothetical protein [Corynebacterium sp.]MDO5097153.1 hypothetical protein [Corynebacterium sp.]
MLTSSSTTASEKVIIGIRLIRGIAIGMGSFNWRLSWLDWDYAFRLFLLGI